MSSTRAVIVPGIMGSALTYKGHEIWGDNLFANIKRLTENPSVLKWDGRRADARLIHTIQISTILPLPRASLLKRLTAYLSGNPEFSAPDGTIECAYDWRASVIESGEVITRTIQKFYSRSLASPIEDGESRLAVFSHSMGGLVIRAAIANGLIHPTRIDRIVHIGSPLRGAPVAFRTAFEKTSLPLLEEWFTLYHLFRLPHVKPILLDCFRSFPSLYELFPPLPVKYLQYSPILRKNPLEDAFIGPDNKKVATESHRVSQAATRLLVSHSVPVYTIYSIQVKTDLEYEVAAMAYPRGYQIVKVAARDWRGDGTVPEYSAEGDETCIKRPVVACKHAFMCNSTKVTDMLKTMSAATSA
jgi:hypothetical protein